MAITFGNLSVRYGTESVLKQNFWDYEHSSFYFAMRILPLFPSDYDQET